MRAEEPKSSIVHSYWYFQYSADVGTNALAGHLALKQISPDRLLHHSQLSAFCRLADDTSSAEWLARAKGSYFAT